MPLLPPCLGLLEQELYCLGLYCLPLGSKVPHKIKEPRIELPFFVFLRAEEVKGEVVATQPCFTQACCAHIPGSVTGSWTAPCSITPAVHSQPREWVQLPPSKCVKVVSAHRGLCSMSLSSGTGSSWLLGRECDTAAAGPGSPIPPSLQPEAIWQDSTGASTGPQGADPRQWAAPLGSLGPP